VAGAKGVAVFRLVPASTVMNQGLLGPVSFGRAFSLPAHATCKLLAFIDFIAFLADLKKVLDYRTTRLRRPLMPRSSAEVTRVHRIPHPTSVTIAKRPSKGARDGASL
jgi:hypothetical protein